MKSLEYESLPGSQTTVRNYFKGRKILSALVAVVSVTAVVLLITVSFTTSGKGEIKVSKDEPALLKSTGGRIFNSRQESKRAHSKPTKASSKNVSEESARETNASNNETDVPYNFVQRTKSLVVRTNEGCVEGTTLESRAGRNYAAFYNVPYAAPPVGELRFLDPQPPRKWEGIRSAKTIGPQCIQTEKYAPVLRSSGEEDCLYLNIYTPQLPTKVSSSPCTENSTEIPVNPNLPVMVYFHGGSFNSGNGSRYGPDYFMDEDVIIITFEYRLGALGFMTTGDMEIRGNMGFKDSIQALRWIQQNIAAFGGDPKRVTIFGNSSGSIHVHAMMLSSMSKGLFQRAISQSGTAIAQGGGIIPTAIAAQIAFNVADQFGCKMSANNETLNTKEMTNCLRRVDAKELAIIQNLLFYPIPEPIPEDGDLSNVFYHKAPYEIMNDAENYPMKVPWIIGDVSAEELSDTLLKLKDLELIQGLNENWAETLPKTMPFKHSPSKEQLESIKEFYFGHYIKRHISNNTRNELVSMYSDFKWTAATKLAAMAHAQHSPVYLYWLTKEPSKSYADKNKGGFTAPFGVGHADELQYFFLYDGYPEIPIGSPYARFSQKLIENWVEFAATGAPALVDWTPIDPAENGTVWFRLDDDDKLGETRTLRRRVRFWEDFTYELFG